MTKKLLFILFAFFGFVASAQIPTVDIVADVNIFPKEKIVFSINSELLLAGELLQYKVFNLDALNKESKLSKVLYVSLRNENDSIVFNHKLKVENGMANGDFFIPSTLKTGVYRLIGYTNFSRNNIQDGYALKTLYVLNTFIKTTEVNKMADTINIQLSPKTDYISSEVLKKNQPIKITSNKSTYGFREKVTLNLEGEPENMKGNFVLSVRRIDPIEILGDVSEIKNKVSSQLFYLPELRGEIISGVVSSTLDGAPAQNKTVSLTIPGADYIFKIAKTDANGRFFFSITEGYDADKSIIQLSDSEKEENNFTITLDKKDFNLGKDIPYKLVLSSDIKSWLEERSVQLQIENAYFDTKKDSIINNPINTPFYNTLGTVFLLDDYTRFPSVRETFIEVIRLAAVRGSGTNARFVVNNAYDPNGIAKFNSLPPLVLLDGMQITNNEFLLNYNARDIKSIRVVTDPYRYGSKIYSGIIAVETKNGDFIIPVSKNVVEVNLPPALKEKEYYNPNYITNSTLTRIPDYRVQLLWQPKIILSNKKLVYSFYTSDVPGYYLVQLDGFNASGKHITIKKPIMVE